MSATAEKLMAFGAFHMYRAPLRTIDWAERAAANGAPMSGGVNGRNGGNGGRGTPAAAPPRSVPKLLDATRTQLSALAAIRQAARHGPIPRSLQPPPKLRRHWLLSICVLAAASSSYHKHATTLNSPEWWAEKRAMLAMVVEIHNRWWATHVSEPLEAVAKEFFHGYEPIVEAARVQDAQASFERMLEAYVRDMNAELPRAKLEASVSHTHISHSSPPPPTQMSHISHSCPPHTHRCHTQLIRLLPHVVTRQLFRPFMHVFTPPPKSRRYSERRARERCASSPRRMRSSYSLR